MNKMKYTYLVFTLLISVIFLESCGTSSTKTASDESLNSFVSLTQKQMETGEIRLDSLQIHAFDGEIQTNGYIDVPPGNKAIVHAVMNGYIRDISVLEGDFVRKGERLITIENADFIELQQNYLEAKAQVTYLKSDYERQKNLANEAVSSQKTYLKAEAEYRATLSRATGLGEKLKLLGFNLKSIEQGNFSAIAQISAPIEGYVSAVNVTKGSYLDPQIRALEITNLDDIHLAFELFEKDINRIRINQRISFQLPDSDSKQYSGTVALIGKTISGSKRMIPVHGHVSDRKNAPALLPGMYVKGTIFTDQMTALALPEDAIVKVNDKFFVLVLDHQKEGTNYFLRKEVTIGENKNGFTEVRNATDFPSGTQFVTNGAFGLIKE